MLKRSATKCLLVMSVMVGFFTGPVWAASPPRLALVIGNSDYRAGLLKTPSNDAILLAQSLQGAGFEVMAARDLDQATMRKSMTDFLTKVNAAGSETVAFVYIAGYGLQYQGENYILPVDANIMQETDIAGKGVRIGDFVRSLSLASIKSRFVVLDAARETPFLKNSTMTVGLAYLEPDPGTLVAINAAPGTLAPEGQAANGVYASSLSSLIAQGGLQPDDLFSQLRIKVNAETKGAQVPWHLAKLQGSFLFHEAAPGQAAATPAELPKSVSIKPKSVTVAKQPEPAKPVQVVKPAEVAAPTEAPKPVEAAPVVEAAKPADPVPVIEAAKPAEVTTVEPVKPTEPAKPAEVAPRIITAAPPTPVVIAPPAPTVVAPAVALSVVPPKPQLAAKPVPKKHETAKRDAAPRAPVQAASNAETRFWRQVDSDDTAEGYRAYLSRYPRGAHAAEARHALGNFAAAARENAVDPGYEDTTPAYRRQLYGNRLYDEYGDPIPVPPRGFYPHRRRAELDDPYDEPPVSRFIFRLFP